MGIPALHFRCFTFEGLMEVFPPEREARAAREAPGGINILRTFA